MSDFYCHECAAKNGWMNVATEANLTGTPYQNGRFIKHTTPSGIYPIISVFDDPSYSANSGYLASASMFGCLEVDDSGRRNLVWDAEKRVGQTFSGTTVLRADSAIKVVLPYNPRKIHLFPTASDLISRGQCVGCGRFLASSQL